MKNHTRKQILYALAGIALLAFIGAVTLSFFERNQDSGRSIGVQGDSHPSLERDIDSFSPLPEVRDALQLIVDEIEADEENEDLWLVLGNLRKGMGDFEGAIEAWEYVLVLEPNHIVAPNNLGNLYHFELKKYPEAEQAFRKAIENDPGYLLSYQNLFDLYRYSYQTDTDKAEHILKEGIEQNPETIELRILLAEWYAQMGEIEDALVVYEEVVDLAEARGDTKRTEETDARMRELRTL